MNHGTFFVWPNDPTDWATIPADRDRACGANVAFADGHVHFKKWQYLGRKRINPDTPAANAQDRADLRWVLDTVTGAGAP